MTRSDLLDLMEPFFERRGKDECWPWIGSLTRYGYADFWVGRWFTPHRIHGHRMMFQILYGPLPKELQACHHCDNRKCVNPAHMFIGTHKDNAEDRERKGRGNHQAKRVPNLKNRGFDNGNSRLKEADLPQIRKLLKIGVPQTEIGKQFGVSQNCISQINLGNSYINV